MSRGYGRGADKIFKSAAAIKSKGGTWTISKFNSGMVKRKLFSNSKNPSTISSGNVRSARERLNPIGNRVQPVGHDYKLLVRVVGSHCHRLGPSRAQVVAWPYHWYVHEVFQITLMV